MNNFTGPGEIDPGQKFPFQLELPKDIPSPCKSENFNIKYFLKAEIERPKKANISTEIPFYINDVLVDNTTQAQVPIK